MATLGGGGSSVRRKKIGASGEMGRPLQKAAEGGNHM